MTSKDGLEARFPTRREGEGGGGNRDRATKGVGRSHPFLY